MTDGTKIEWTNETWNPTTGCTAVSAGCDHCYAARKSATRLKHLPEYAGLTFSDGRFNGTVRLLPERLDKPFKWRSPRRIFVNSMSDLFHVAVPDEFIVRVFAVMALAPRHTFQVLTKRHGRMRSLLSTSEFHDRVNNAVVDAAGINLESPAAIAYRPRPWPLPNVWLGVSVENQQWADIRVPALLDTPAAVRFLSCEPLLGPVDLRAKGCPRVVYDGPYKMRCSLGGDGEKCAYHGRFERKVYHGIDWVIVGGESGPHARPMHPQWARRLRDQCVAAGVPFFFKQQGEWALGASPTGDGGVRAIVEDDGRFAIVNPGERVRAISMFGATLMRRVGKHNAGRELDGRTWDEYPQAVSA